jgi:hypothetical protein
MRGNRESMKRNPQKTIEKEEEERWDWSGVCLSFIQIWTTRISDQNWSKSWRFSSWAATKSGDICVEGEENMDEGLHLVHIHGWISHLGSTFENVALEGVGGERMQLNIVTL